MLSQHESSLHNDSKFPSTNYMKKQATRNKVESTAKVKIYDIYLKLKANEKGNKSENVLTNGW